MENCTKRIFCVIALLMFLSGVYFTVLSLLPYVLGKFGYSFGTGSSETVCSATSGLSGDSNIISESLSADYPFKPEDKKQMDLVNKNDGSNKQFLTETIMTKLKSVIDVYATSDNKMRTSFCRVAAFSYRCMGKHFIEDAEDNVYCLDNGYLVYTKRRETTKDGYDYFLDFSDWLKSQNTPLLYVVPMSKSDDTVVDYPDCISTEYGKMKDNLLSCLTKNNIGYFNTKSYLLSKDSNFFNWVYKTDHHWNVNAGIAVAGETLRILKDDYGLNVDYHICDAENYKPKTYNNIFLGSMGRKVTRGYASMEDLTVMYPTFETKFRVQTQNLDKKGLFADTIIDKSQLNPPASQAAENLNSYMAFLYGDRDLIRITNENIHNGVKLLVLKQSDANVVNSYMACGVEHLDIIDPRWFAGSIRSYIEQTNPDAVIICANDIMVSQDNAKWILK